MGYRDELVRRLNAAWAARGQADVDVLFVLDCTATMVGEIEALRDAIPSLADALGHGGGKGRFGLIELRDGLQGEGTVVHAFGGRDVTEDPIVFQREVAALQARGPSPRPDGALDALLLACPPPFTIDPRRVIVFVTDGRPPASIIFMSEAYTRKLSANRELELAHVRAFEENAEHILALRLDDTDFPGLANVLAGSGEYRDYVCEYIDLWTTTMGTVALSGLTTSRAE
ncbi:MAG: hypothetical protein IPK82_17685 [Polyangiaceae bacterium]|nr:hypothetical protein [Polyangiaceae bacterium]